MFGIINKATKEFFAGFDLNNKAKWTADKASAWKSCKIAAIGQAILLVTNGHNAQKKPVAL